MGRTRAWMGFAVLILLGASACGAGMDGQRPDAAVVDTTSEAPVVPEQDAAVDDAEAPGPDGADALPPGDDSTPTKDGGPTPDAPPPDPEAIVVGAWNLHNFSIYGTREFRIDDVAARIASLETDVLGVEEIKVEDGSNGQGTQAWDALLERLPDHAGVHNPYNTVDTTVGLIYNTATTTLVDQQVLFENDSFAFPRPPLDATVEVRRGNRSETFHVVVLHLKAFADSVNRRRDACAKLHGFLQMQTDKRYILVGDYNDDPYDPPADNAFTGTFLNAEPTYHFVTASLPPETVTSLGFYHFVDGMQITGEFLDHIVMTGELHGRFSQVTPEVVALPESEFPAWERDYSDHFPIRVRLAF